MKLAEHVDVTDYVQSTGLADKILPGVPRPGGHGSTIDHSGPEDYIFAVTLQEDTRELMLHAYHAHTESGHRSMKIDIHKEKIGLSIESSRKECLSLLHLARPLFKNVHTLHEKDPHPLMVNRPIAA